MHLNFLSLGEGSSLTAAPKSRAICLSDGAVLSRREETAGPGDSALARERRDTAFLTRTLLAREDMIRYGCTSLSGDSRH